jgi:hypothetical protein
MRRREAGQSGGWGCGPEQLAATVPCASVYDGCIAMARIHNIIRWHTHRCSDGIPGALYLNNIIYRYLYHIIYIFTAKSCVRLRMILWIWKDCVGLSDVSGFSTSTSDWTVTWRGKGVLLFADSRYFHNETRSGGYLDHGWEGIWGKELWLWFQIDFRAPPPGGNQKHSMKYKQIESSITWK